MKTSTSMPHCVACRAILLALVVPFGLSNSASAVLISTDFISDTFGGAPAPVSGDTTIAAGPKVNSVGLMFTGQVGTWNGPNVAPFGNQTLPNFGPTAPLTDGTGGLTAVTFEVAGPYRGGGAAATDLRIGKIGLEPGVSVGTSLGWTLSGLTPNGSYSMVMFGSTGSNNQTHVANGVAAVHDTEGDWNWAALTADAAGQIVGTFTVPGDGSGNPTGFGDLFGFQIESVQTAPAVPEPGTLMLAAVGLLGLGACRRRMRRC